MITITITTDNAAFEDSKADEVARILRHLATRIANEDYDTEPGTVKPLRDNNGNDVGIFEVV